MKKIIVNKESLSNYQSFLMDLENADLYEIDIKDVLDFYCEAVLVKNNRCYATDGYVKISSNASKNIAYHVMRDGLVGTEWDHRLRERLEVCDGAADVVSFLLKNEKKEMEISVPYSPLLGVLDGYEMEYSNCPSFEIDEDGNMLICFGTSSKMPKRKDNNYAELVLGWKNYFGNYEPEVLKVRAVNISMYGEEKINVELYFKILDKRTRRKTGKLVFKNCKNVSMDLFLFGVFDVEIYMSKMANGKIYVAFDGLGVDFNCDSVV